MAFELENPGGSGILTAFFARVGAGLFRSTAHLGGGGDGEVFVSVDMLE